MNPGTARQGGAIAILFVLMLLLLIGLCGMAIDLGLIYNRKAELQGVANSAAVAAAQELNGSSSGVANALAKAAGTVAQLHYQYDRLPVVWSNAAIAFSKNPDGDWLDAGAAQAAPDGLLFAKVDTSQLDVAYGTVELVFMRVLSDELTSATTGAQAVAGRLSINATALALCAMSNSPAAARANPGPPANTELVEFGFRRGVSYDLMNLNPAAATTTPENFVIDPIDPPGQPGVAANVAPDVVGPFLCSGKLAMPRLSGGPITVGRPFPLNALFNQLNSRFDLYNGNLCNPNGAPPDSNIKSYTYSAIPWMAGAPSGQAAESTSSGNKLWTVADPLPAPGDNTAPKYGPLWTYARAVPYAVYTPGVAEPASGYTPFAASAWATLYKPGAPVAGASYPSAPSTPYRALSGANFAAPSNANRPGLANRRVLNVALLSCPVGAGATVNANVLGIGRFFMTVPATATRLYAEFAGAVAEPALGGQVELYQ